MTDHPPRPKPECAHEHWRVEVSTCGKQIVAIETECLAGREISDADAETIRTCARHLLAFLGDTPGDPAQQVPPPAAEPVSDPYKLRDAQEEQDPVAWQWRAIISGNPTSWLHMEETVVKFRYRYAEELRQGIYELRPLFASPQQGNGSLRQFVVDHYANQDMNHVDFRVRAYELALGAPPQKASPLVRCPFCDGSGDHPGGPPGNQECPKCDGSGWLSEPPALHSRLQGIHSALDDALGDSDVTSIEDEDELRDRHPVQWAAEKLAGLIQELEAFSRLQEATAKTGDGQ